MQPVINCEEQIGKTVGRRVQAAPLSTAPNSLINSNLWRDYGFLPKIKKGVYRFKTHEEADQWLMDHLIQKRRANFPSSRKAGFS